MKTIRILGVPEHFNLPWHLAIDEGAFESRGIDLQWHEIPEGTGKMCQMLQNKETELAVVLTEGIVKSISDGNPVQIVQEYIASPLLWGIHVGTGSPYQSIPDLEHTKPAISRFGSGSHLMACVNAQNKGWDTAELQFEVVHTLDNAIRSLTSGESAYFMWEHFTTKPLVDNGTFRWLGDCPTPWPCFVLAGTVDFIQNEPGTLHHILEIINLYSTEFPLIPSIDRTLANRYGQQLKDIREWLACTRWSQTQLTLQQIEKVVNTLYDLKLIDHKLPAPSMLYIP
jgi:ABC-type nitrate/sulfonate/bicarbonate transport system substrate-binding protein